LNTLYHNAPDGLSGNEDCGQMSAWYVLSAMGFYPVTPGTTDYIIGTPMFSSAIIHMDNGKQFAIKAAAVSDKNFYIQSAALNNTVYKKSYLQYGDIAKGGSLNFSMGVKASLFGSVECPSTSIDDNKIVLNPVIDGGPVSFTEAKMVKIYSNQVGVDIFYTLDGSNPAEPLKKYTAPFTVNATTTVKSIAINNAGQASFVTTANYIKRTNNWSIQLKSNFEPQYEAGGAEGLIDGIEGSANWRKGNWMGFQKTDIEAIIDLKENKTISTVTMGFLQDTRAWIVAPRKFVIEVSNDGNVFTQVYSGENFLPIDDLNVQVKKIVATFTPVAARYVKIKALQYGKLPAWHEGAGGDTHLFTDEIDIR
jgi:hypothetical protein